MNASLLLSLEKEDISLEDPSPKSAKGRSAKRLLEDQVNKKTKTTSSPAGSTEAKQISSTSTTGNSLDPLLLSLEKEDIWVHNILPLVGASDIGSVEQVSHQLQDLVFQASPCPTLRLLNKPQIWLNILSFIGPGEHFFIAGVCRTFQKLYPIYYASIGVPKYSWRRASKYGAIFSSRERAQLWDDNTRGDLDDDVCSTIARYGTLEALKWARQTGFEWDEDTCSAAARSGHFEMLKWAHTNGCDWDEWTTAFAAENGHLEILQYARQQGCPWDDKTSKGAAQNGQLEVLQWARQQNPPCPWDEMVSIFAIRYGNLDIVQFAHESGCPWDSKICYEAVRYRQWHILKYARENGCPMDAGTKGGLARYIQMFWPYKYDP